MTSAQRAAALRWPLSNWLSGPQGPVFLSLTSPELRETPAAFAGRCHGAALEDGEDMTSP